MAKINYFYDITKYYKLFLQLYIKNDHFVS